MYTYEDFKNSLNSYYEDALEDIINVQDETFQEIGGICTKQSLIRHKDYDDIENNENYYYYCEDMFHDTPIQQLSDINEWAIYKKVSSDFGEQFRNYSTYYNFVVDEHPDGIDDKLKAKLVEYCKNYAPYILKDENNSYIEGESVNYMLESYAFYLIYPQLFNYFKKATK